jgi:hypothetical protein
MKESEIASLGLIRDSKTQGIGVELDRHLKEIEQGDWY